MKRVASAAMRATERSSLDALLASCLRAVRHGRVSTASAAGGEMPPAANSGCWHHVRWPTARDVIGSPMAGPRAAP